MSTIRTSVIHLASSLFRQNNEKLMILYDISNSRTVTHYCTIEELNKMIIYHIDQTLQLMYNYYKYSWMQFTHNIPWEILLWNCFLTSFHLLKQHHFILTRSFLCCCLLIENRICSKYVLLHSLLDNCVTWRENQHF